MTSSPEGPSSDPTAVEPTIKRVGRYQVHGRLGAGGMGEVYRGWDPELRRSVALKRVHPDRAGDGQGAQRLRREAQAVARLSHPAVAQIFDVQSHGGVPWIVMELVTGSTLIERHRRQEMSRTERIETFRQIADGLSAAHQRGILHRDLKNENVLVRDDGQVKILDFGLAKALGPEPLGDSDDGLTGERLVGTCRAMSPEQALEQPLDARSDLFSLGVLIYEVESGQSPFSGKTRFETLQNVLGRRPPSLREVAPDTPNVLSLLVDRLLSKDPQGRPRSADRVSNLLARIAETDDSPSELAADDLESTLFGPPDKAPKLVARRRPRIKPVALAVFVILASAVPLTLALRQPILERSASTPRDMISAEDFETLLDLRSRWRSVRNLEDLRLLEQELRALERKSPSLVEAPLLRSRVQRRLFAVTRDLDLLTAAFGSATRARALAPDSSAPLIAELEVVLTSQSLDRAEQLITQLEQRFPGDPGVDGPRAWWLRLQGRTEEAILVMRRIVARSSSLEGLFELAKLEVSIADFDSARRRLELILEQASSHGPALSLLAQVELQSGNLQRATTLYGELLERHRDAGSLTNMALVHMLEGRPGQALGLLREAAAKAPAQAAIQLNLADAARAAGLRAEALAGYRRVIELTDQDPVSGDWQRWTVRAQALAQLGERSLALAALEQARSISYRPEVALEVAVTLAELGDDPAALKELRFALNGESGLSKVWLRLPSLARFRDRL